MKERTREIIAFGGLVNRMPNYAMIFMILTLANVGSLVLRLYRRIPFFLVFFKLVLSTP